MQSEPLDDFTDVSGWTAVASGLAELRISTESAAGGPAMRLDFDFKGGGGFVVARKPFGRILPESYALGFAVRGAAPPNRFELKIADPDGHNVWWWRRDDFEFADDWRTIRIPSSAIEFAWGPAGGGAPFRLGALELVIAAATGDGGCGTVWLRDLRFEDRTYRGTPVVRASSACSGHSADAAVDGDPRTYWRSDACEGPHRLEIDFGVEREYGGLVLDWAPGARPRRFRVEVSGEAANWTTVYSADGADVERSFVYLPGACSRRLALVLETDDPDGCGVAELAVQPFEFSRSVHAFFEQVSASEPRGHYPRWLGAEGTYWTSIGLPDGRTCALLNEEGMLEPDRGAFSIEPFLYTNGRLLTWADADVSQTLEDGWIPVPSSVWRTAELTLRTTAFAARYDAGAAVYVRYRVENRAASARRARLFAAIRPFQVNPPWQAFGKLGGMRRIETIAFDEPVAEVNGQRVVVALTPPAGFGAAPFEHGAITVHLARGGLPARTSVHDAFGYAAAAFVFDVDLAPGASRDVYLAVPFEAAEAAAVQALQGADAAAALERTLADWRERLGTVTFALPDRARDHAAVARTAAAHVLVQRDGAALQPGPRRYARSWIRDGATMAAALLRLGRSTEAIEFVHWYASHQRADGCVPCSVDRDGDLDARAEHDSHGQLIFAAMECFRFTRERALLAELWPAVRKAVDYMETLRAQRLGPEYDASELRARRGLLPESVSHEGYLAHPVHSYWDDFWALQGYSDAAEMAALLGERVHAQRIAAIRDDFTTALRASIARTIAERSIDYVPASVEWADFDPTATAVAVGLLDALDDLPLDALERTFDRYLEGFRRRRRGEIGHNYSAYELRIVPALLHLGRRADAVELLGFLLEDRRPRPWNQWPEISWRDLRSPGHIGDMPHAWIGAEYVLALRTLFAYERGDGALVLGAGIPAHWLDGGAEVGVSDLPTHFGRLDLRMRRVDARTLEVSVGGDIRIPPRGIVVRPPLPAPLTAVEVDGRTTDVFDAESATVITCPARAILRC